MLLSCCDHFDKSKEKEDKKEQNKTETADVGKVKNDSLPSTSGSIGLDNVERESDKEAKEMSDKDRCFLCLKESDKFCNSCLQPYCSKDHYDLHTISNIDMPSGERVANYCFPFRVLQRPEVRIQKNMGLKHKG